VKQLRNARGLSQERFAELTGLTVKYIGQVERGDINPTVAMLVRIAAGLSVDVGHLFGPGTSDRGAARGYTLTPRQFEQIEETWRMLMRVKRRRARATRRSEDDSPRS
jgi:transcriptional regulator with XRE-family HTH domain